MKILTFALLLTVLAGCAASHPGFAPTKGGYEFTYVDNPAERRIDLHMVSHNKTPFCLTISDWPNGDGKMETVADYAIIEIDNTPYHMQPYTSEYCPGCGIQVRNGDVVDGFLRYADFQIPEDKFFATKKLIMSPRMPSCR